MVPLIRGTGTIGPLAGRLVTSQYSRSEEYAADAHGVVLLRRTGYPKQMMLDALTWLMQVSGPDSGGFFATHPGTADRITAGETRPDGCGGRLASLDQGPLRRLPGRC